MVRPVPEHPTIYIGKERTPRKLRWQLRTLMLMVAVLTAVSVLIGIQRLEEMQQMYAALEEAFLANPRPGEEYARDAVRAFATLMTSFTLMILIGITVVPLRYLWMLRSVRNAIPKVHAQMSTWTYAMLLLEGVRFLVWFAGTQQQWEVVRFSFGPGLETVPLLAMLILLRLESTRVAFRVPVVASVQEATNDEAPAMDDAQAP